MKDYIFETSHWVPYPVDEVFEFFKAAENLEKITPPWLNFKILKTSTPDIEEGTLIDYRLKLYGIPMYWKTEISSWQPPHQFTDSQLKGPYSKWVHTHRFEAKDGGTLLSDRVEYRVPGWFFGSIAHKFFVRNNVEQIFAHRLEQIEKFFPTRKTAISVDKNEEAVLANS